MAHRVKCSICQQTFDRDKEEFIATSARRYAHKKCYERQQDSLDSEQKARQDILDYTKKLFKENFNKIKIETQMDKMVRENSNYQYNKIHVRQQIVKIHKSSFIRYEKNAPDWVR